MAKNVEQVALCKLGEMLGTGSYDELNLGFQLVGEPLPEGPWPQTIHPELLKAIKEASDEQIAKVSSPWARIDEFGGMASPESLVDYLTRLREFLRENDGSFFLVMAL